MKASLIFSLGLLLISRSQQLTPSFWPFPDIGISQLFLSTQASHANMDQRVIAAMDAIHSEAFERRMLKLMSEWHVPGMAIAAFNADRVTGKGFGLGSIEPKVNATADTIWDCASTSKSMTAAAVAKVMAEESSADFAWTTPMSELLKDEFVLNNDIATAIVSVEDILSHRSGLPGHDFSLMGIEAKEPDSLQSITLNLRNLALSSSPRTDWQYCNMLFSVAAYLVEKKSGQTFTKYLQQHFFDVLGMTSTYLLPSAVLRAGQEQRYSKPYTWNNDTQTHERAPWVEQPEGLGAGLIQSTALDYAKWVQAVMTKNKSVLNEESWAELIKPRMVQNPGDGEEELPPFTSHLTYGLGWDISFYRGYRIISHGGSERGYKGLILFMPKLNFGTVMYGNSDGFSTMHEIISMELIDEILDIPTPDRVDWAERARKDEADKEDPLDKKRKELNGDKPWSPSEPTVPLSDYTGVYSNTGYHELEVVVKDGKLHIDATERTIPFVMDFEHVRDNRVFIGHLDDFEDVDYLKTEFDIDDNGRVQRLGIEFEESLKDLIWFERQDG